MRKAWLIAAMLLMVSASSLPSVKANDISGYELKSTALEAGPSAMAEPAVAINARDRDHVVVAADPYLAPVRIVVRESTDGGATWSGPIDILPPGFSKSYDPSIAVLADGSVVVVGGASQEGAPQCQPGSAVFLAELGDGSPRYSLIEPPREGVYVDRPRMVADPESDTMFVSWTRSVGTGAECLGAPLSSSIMFTRSTGPRTFSPAVAIPSTGFPAPFGSSMTVADDGSVHVATRERGPNGRDRIAVVSSDDGGRSFSKPATIAETAAFPTSIPGLGGFTSGIPVIDAGPTGLAAVWPSINASGSRVEVALKPSGERWRPQRALGSNPGYEVFPTVSYDDSGRLWLLYGRHSGSEITFNLRHRSPTGWSSPRTISRAPASGYLEVGQFLGLSVSGERVVAAVPLDGPISRLRVFSKRLDPPPSPSPTASGSEGPSEGKEPSSGGAPDDGPRGWSTVLLILGGLFGAVALLRLRRFLRNPT